MEKNGIKNPGGSVQEKGQSAFDLFLFPPRWWVVYSSKFPFLAFSPPPNPSLFSLSRHFQLPTIVGVIISLLDFHISFKFVINPSDCILLASRNFRRFNSFFFWKLQRNRVARSKKSQVGILIFLQVCQIDQIFIAFWSIFWYPIGWKLQKPQKIFVVLISLLILLGFLSLCNLGSELEKRLVFEAFSYGKLLCSTIRTFWEEKEEE